MDAHRLAAYLLGFAVSLIAIFIGLLVERPHPDSEGKPAAVSLNLFCTFIYSLVAGLLGPALQGIVVLLVNAAGGGWIALPDNGWGLIPAFAVYFLVADFAEYSFHRFQHRLPVLWSMHSLHHSDASLNISTTGRHFWIEPVIKTFTIYLLLALLLKASPVIVGAYLIVSLYNYFPHMNVRVGFGPLATVLISPQYHRLHHSSLPEYFDCNFAGLLPVFDVIFGTYREPKANEYPPTGLDSGDAPRGLSEVLYWPLRHVVRRLTVGRSHCRSS